MTWSASTIFSPLVNKNLNTGHKELIKFIELFLEYKNPDFCLLRKTKVIDGRWVEVVCLIFFDVYKIQL